MEEATPKGKNGIDPDSRPSKGAVREYVEAVGIALLVALLLRFFVIEAFKIPSGSMIETLEIGDFIFVNKMSYRTEIPYSVLSIPIPGGGTTLAQWSQPERGDIAVFRFPSDLKIDYIKRIIGLPGDQIELRDNVLYVNDEALPRKFMRTVDYRNQNCGRERARMYQETLGDASYTVLIQDGRSPFENYGPITVKDGHLFAMGDNRDNSSDSRAWGQVPIEHVKGRALFVWLSVDRCSPLPGRFRLSRIGHAVK